MSDPFLHDLPDFKNLLEITARANDIDEPSLIEKDYWIMHSLYGLQKLGFTFELKGGTSLSKGYGIIHRFSEDLDIRIEPEERFVGFKVYVGKNHDDPKHRKSRKDYFDWLAKFFEEKISGISQVVRDETFDDAEKNRNGGIRLLYKNEYGLPAGIKEGILLEVGFDRTSPFQRRDITSWAYENARASSTISFADNRAIGVPCYEPKYTFVEKLQAVVRKYRLFQQGKGSRTLPANFVRHYYDLFKLIDLPEVQVFIGTAEYEAYKKERFKGDDTIVANSDVLRLADADERALFEKEYERTASMYFRDRPTFEEILQRMQKDLPRL